MPVCWDLLLRSGWPGTVLFNNPHFHGIPCGIDLVMAGTVISLYFPALCYCIADVGAELWILKVSLSLGRRHGVQFTRTPSDRRGLCIADIPIHRYVTCVKKTFGKTSGLRNNFHNGSSSR